FGVALQPPGELLAVVLRFLGVGVVHARVTAAVAAVAGQGTLGRLRARVVAGVVLVQCLMRVDCTQPTWGRKPAFKGVARRSAGRHDHSSKSSPVMMKIAAPDSRNGSTHQASASLNSPALIRRQCEKCWVAPTTMPKPASVDASQRTSQWRGSGTSISRPSN